MFYACYGFFFFWIKASRIIYRHAVLSTSISFSSQVAPFNTYYSQLEDHLAQVGVDSSINRWDEPLVLGMVDPHDSLSHPAGVSDVQAESATCIDPDQFTNFLVCSNCYSSWSST